MLNHPTSSPMMTRMLGGFAFAACACAVVPPPASKRLEMANAPSVSFRTLAPKSILLSFSGNSGWPREARVGWADRPEQLTKEMHRQRIEDWLDGKPLVGAEN